MYALIIGYTESASDAVHLNCLAFEDDFQRDVANASAIGSEVDELRAGSVHMRT